MIERLKRLGDQSKQLLDNEAFQEAFKRLEKEYYDLFMKTGVSDSDKREQIFTSVNVLTDVKKRLERFYEEAQYAQAQAEARDKAEKANKDSVKI